jgi:hypothetical protein
MLGRDERGRFRAIEAACSHPSIDEARTAFRCCARFRRAAQPCSRKTARSDAQPRLRPCRSRCAPIKPKTRQIRASKVGRCREMVIAGRRNGPTGIWGSDASRNSASPWQVSVAHQPHRPPQPDALSVAVLPLYGPLTGQWLTRRSDAPRFSSFIRFSSEHVAWAVRDKSQVSARRSLHCWRWA